MNRLPWLIALAALYEAYAVETRHVPTITQLVHSGRSHFRPRCRDCGMQLVKAGPQYRGFLR